MRAHVDDQRTSYIYARTYKPPYQLPENNGQRGYNFQAFSSGEGVAVEKYCDIKTRRNDNNLLVKLQSTWAPTNEGQLTVVGSIRGLTAPG